jgi:prophage tail gpP-like protein
MTTQRVHLSLSDQSGTVLGIQSIDHVSIKRDLADIAGSFEITVLDQAREFAAGNMSSGGLSTLISQGMNAAISLDGTLVLAGRVDAVSLSGDATSDRMTIRGRDRTGDLVDCAAAPTGPTEFRNLSLAAIATRICAPFGIDVTTQTDIGANFVLASLNQHDTAHAFLAGLARQRATLLASDGVGGLLLTSGGSTRAPSSLTRGVNILRYDCTRDWSKRFSDYYVKGQSNASGYATGDAGMTHATTPGADPEDSGYAKPTILMTGHASDPEITSYRPTVRMTRSQSGMASTQAQAEWALRVAKGEAEQLNYTVKDWRAGDGRALWLPNAVTSLTDPLVGIEADMLIAGVTYLYDNDEGARTELRVVGLTAYDLTDQAAKRKSRSTQKQVLQSSYAVLGAP